jgi:hypothetical protein
MRVAWVVLLASAGCFNPNYGSGALQCENGKCPSGYHCATNDTCDGLAKSPVELVHVPGVHIVPRG